MKKKALFAFAALLSLAACDNKQISVAQDETSEVRTEVSSEVAFEVARNYFFNSGQTIPSDPKITDADHFEKLFGMAAVMGEEGRPTDIDFSKQFVLAIVLPVTDIETEIVPVKVELKSDTLYYTYEVKTGDKQSFTIQPISIIVLDKQYESKEVVLSLM